MKNTIAALAMGVLLAGCQQQSQEPTETTKDQPVQAIADKDKMGYAVGVNMAATISSINSEMPSVGLEMDAVKRGFIDGLAENTQLGEEEVAQQLQILQEKIRLAQQQMMQQQQQGMEAMIAEKKVENEAFFSGLESQGYSKTESGLYYKEIQAAAEGAAKPSETDAVKVHYVGTFIDGEQFDSSVERKQPFEFSLKGGVIQGWLEGVRLMSVGSKYQFVIPPALAYGDGGGRMPPESILLFDIELLEIITPTAK